MAEWILEEGIGEDRAALIADGEILQAHIEPDTDSPRAGMICAARLREILAGKRTGWAVLDDGSEVLLDPLPRAVTEGAELLVEITRSAIPEPGKVKGPRARPAPKGRAPCDAPSLRDRIAATGTPIAPPAAPGTDALEAAGWSELLEQAATGAMPFPGGALRIALTPAMTVIDVDGALPPAELAIAGAKASAAAIRRLDISGSIVIDLPSLEAKADRQAAAKAFDAALPLPFERTAINGFGLLQIVRKRARPSLLEHAQYDSPATAARALLRRAEHGGGSGPVTLTAHPEITAHLTARPDWTAALERRLGRPVQIAVDPALAIWAGHASAAHPV